MMKMHRVWIEIVILSSAIAVAISLLIATLGTAAGAVESQLLIRPSERVELDRFSSAVRSQLFLISASSLTRPQDDIAADNLMGLV